MVKESKRRIGLAVILLVAIIVFGAFSLAEWGDITLKESLATIYYIFVGIMIALLVNVYMSYDKPKLKDIQTQLDTHKKLLEEIKESKEQKKND